jgi:hypothetical protein
MKFRHLFLLLIVGFIVNNCAKHVNPDTLNMTYLRDLSYSSSDDAQKATQDLVEKINKTKNPEERQVYVNQLAKLYKDMGYKEGVHAIKDIRKEQVEKMSKLLQEEPTPLKMPDTIVRVLFLPYVDENKVLHGQSYKFMKIDEGEWVLGDYMLKPGESIKEVTPLDRKEMSATTVHPLKK